MESKGRSGLTESPIQVMEQNVKQMQIEKGEYIPYEDFEFKIWNQQIEFFQDKVEESNRLVESLQEEFDSDDLHLNRAEILSQIQFAKSQIVFFEKQIIQCNYDLYLLRKKKNKHEPLILTPYY